MFIVQKLFVLVLSCLLVLMHPIAYATQAYHTTSLLMQSPDLIAERNLLTQHFEQIKLIKEHREQQGDLYMQPINKSEPCKISTDVFDHRAVPNDGSFILWEGACSKGFADGFGRIYLLRSTNVILELLAKLDYNANDLNTVYYFKDTSVLGQTIFFYGKSNRHKLSGITITQRAIDNNFLVSMLTLDKDNFISYQKESSLNSRYVLNTLGFFNYSHIVYDMRPTSYRSIAISHKMIDADGKDIGFSVIGTRDGEVTGREVQDHNLSKDIIPSDNMLKRVIEVVGKVDANVEESLRTVLEAQPVVDVYKQVICKPDYNSALCDKLKCKQICSTTDTITPDDQRVKELLLLLVQEHNKEAMRTYLRQVIQKRQFSKLPPQQVAPTPKQRSNPVR